MWTRERSLRAHKQNRYWLIMIVLQKSQPIRWRYSFHFRKSSSMVKPKNVICNYRYAGIVTLHSLLFALRFLSLNHQPPCVWFVDLNQFLFILAWIKWQKQTLAESECGKHQRVCVHLFVYLVDRWAQSLRNQFHSFSSLGALSLCIQ